MSEAHPASEAFPPVEKISLGDLMEILAKARRKNSVFDWTPREKDAYREFTKRTRPKGVIYP